MHLLHELPHDITGQYCMGSIVLILSRIYLYSSYFAFGCISKFSESTTFSNLMEYKKMPRHCQPPKDNKKIILVSEKKRFIGVQRTWACSALVSINNLLLMINVCGEMGWLFHMLAKNDVIQGTG